MHRPRSCRPRQAAEKQCKADFTNLWAGQAVAMGREVRATELTRSLAEAAQAWMRKLAG
jgi:nitronate monooxygenase